MDHVKQLRQVLELVNPADLTMNDRLALLALIGRCFENDGGGAILSAVALNCATS